MEEEHFVFHQPTSSTYTPGIIEAVISQAADGIAHNCSCQQQLFAI